MSAASGREERLQFRERLLDAKLLVDAGSPGLYARSGTYESIVDALGRLMDRAGEDQEAQVLRFPPIMTRDTFLRTDYLASFPQLTGAIDVFVGGDSEHTALLKMYEHGEEWAAALTPSDVMLAPAACHPVYDLCAGHVPAGGRRFDVLAYCFRHEPSLDPMRMQSFRMREYVYVGEPKQAFAHREDWLPRLERFLLGLGLPARQAVANDPFFGRPGRMLAATQREDALKIELVVPVFGEDTPTAVASSNYHKDHFGVAFGIETDDGGVAHSACAAFGVDRIALALLYVHGLDTNAWSEAIRRRLWP
jgi:seryl-tRNA synthetase